MSEHDSDKQWKAIGKANPFWGVLTDVRFTQENLDSEALLAFYQSGEANVQRFHDRLISCFDAPAQFGSVLDFGCGVGRLLCAFADRAELLVGVDVSEDMLKHAKTAMHKKGYNDTHLFTNLADAGALTKGYDWVNTYIVLQHIPPIRGYLLIETLLSLVKKGGYLSMHVTIFKDGTIAEPNWKGRIRSWLEQRVLGRPTSSPIMSMYHYDLSKLSQLLVANGFDSFVADHENHGGQHGFVIYARKNSE